MVVLLIAVQFNLRALIGNGAGPVSLACYLSGQVDMNQYAYLDPTSFKPERWARDSPTNEELGAFLSLPFGFGPRSCYGRRLVELECLLRPLTQRRYASNSQPQSLKPFSEIPGPKGLPIVGSLFDLIRGSTKAGDDFIFHQLALKYGPIAKVTTLGKPIIVVSTPDAAANMYRAEGKYPARTNIDDNMNWIYRKNNALTMVFTGGKEWKRIRSSASKQIVPRRVANYAPGLCEIGDGFVEYVRRKRGPDGYLEDVSSALVKWAFQGICFMVYGERLDTFDDSKTDLQEFQNAAIQLIGSLASIANRPPLYKVFPTPTYRHFAQALTDVHKYGSQILKEKYDKVVEAIHSGVVDETKATSMMEQWLIEGNFSQKEALNLSCDIMAAGIDTTSNTATFLLHEVAKQPELQEKLYSEKMTLVRGCIKEILRLQPAIPGVPRMTSEDIDIGGYHIPAKTQVVYLTYTVCRDPKYVEDPITFKPERWARDSPTNEELDAFLSLPFGFGPRSCYGRRLAELELYIMLCMVSKNFKLSTQQHSLKKMQATLVKPDELVKIKFTDRK
ncbi:hypothetical protein EMCRGX_G030723 [Ephydatia muelleri]